MGTGMVTVYALAENGAMLSPAIQRCETLKFAHCVVVAPSNRFVYISHVAPSSKIAVLALDTASGTLTPSSALATGDVRTWLSIRRMGVCCTATIRVDSLCACSAWTL